MLLVLVSLGLLFITAGWKILLAGLGGSLIGFIVFGRWWSKRRLVSRHPPLRPDAYFETGTARMERAESRPKSRFKLLRVNMDLIKAIENFDLAIRLHPADMEAYYNRGIAYGELSRSLEAERDIAKAKDLGYDGP